jgi:hypothetical protein
LLTGQSGAEAEVAEPSMFLSRLVKRASVAAAPQG